jgi:UDP-N-acetylmuramoylalanine--D-glutamate ligase
MQSFQKPIVLLAGGRDKDLPWEDFARLALERVKALVIFGEAADLIASVVQEIGSDAPFRIPIEKAGGLRDAVMKAARISEPGDVVLLSPGGTSFDEFVDFAERGRMFKKWVSELN